MPSADSCGDPFLDKHNDGFLPVGCGAEAVFNFSWEKEVSPDGSGDDDGGDDSESSGIEYPSTPFATTIIPTRALLSTASRHHTTRGTGVISVTPNRSVSRLPPRFTPSPESRHSSFQQLLRIHLNTFNQRLSMLESNTLDMKESLRSMENQQTVLSAQLKELIALQSAGEKSKKAGELERSYSDMESRLSRLEGRLEILIDGFTALAQEMNKMKRARHISRSTHEGRVLPSLSTVLEIPSYSTPRPPVRLISTQTPPISRATVPKSVPTPSHSLSKPTSRPQRKSQAAVTTKAVKITTKLQSVTRPSKTQVQTRSTTKLKTTLRKPRVTSKSSSQSAVKPQTPSSAGRRSAVTAKHTSQPRQTKAKEVKDEAAITKFQLEPPSHKSQPARIPQLHKQADQPRKKDSTSFAKNSGRDISGPPVPKKAPDSVSSPESNSKKSSNPQKKGSSDHVEKKTERNSHKSLSHRTKDSARNVPTTTKQTKVTTLAKKAKTTTKRTTPAKIKAATPNKKSSTTVKRKSTPAPAKTTTVKKRNRKTQRRKKTNSQSAVLDLLKLLNGDYQSSKQKKSSDGSLHVVLGKLAIPIKIIPDT